MMPSASSSSKSSTSDIEDHDYEARFEDTKGDEDDGIVSIEIEETTNPNDGLYSERVSKNQGWSSLRRAAARGAANIAEIANLNRLQQDLANDLQEGDQFMSDGTKRESRSNDPIEDKTQKQGQERGAGRKKKGNWFS